ncbi:MAG: ABC transporter permease [Spirochaetales bacterium]|nr:ABC transporter permease [Spirochaetales bacterium]
MKKFIRLFIRHWAKTPFKVSMTILAVALGTGILILSFSAASILKKQVASRLEQGGVILYTANGQWNADGSVDQEHPPQWDFDALDLVVTEIDAVTASVPVLMVPFDQITTEARSYNLRSAVGTGPEYFDIFSLDILSGSAMTEEDIATGTRRIWISRKTAEILYGSAEAALGKWISPPGDIIRRGPGQREQNQILQYSVAGVYEDPTDIARRSYGIADVIFPYTSLIPGGSNAEVMKNFISGLFVLKSEGLSAERTAASVRQVMAENYGDDVNTLVWEGSPRGTSEYMEELRQAVDLFSVSVNLLGVVLLLTSSLGIFSIMVVESLSRRRDIALERALGASRRLVVREFWSWSAALSLLGALIGALIALLLAKPVLGTLSPLAGEVAVTFREAAGVTPGALLTGILLALGCGGILGLLPAFSALKGNISDTLREA